MEDALKYSNNDDIDISEEETETKYISNVDIPENASLLIKSLIDLWNSKDLQIPFFQRRFVWTLKQASLFIESLLSNLPIPALIFYKDSKEYQYIIDGQQRTKSILYFTGAMKPDEIDNEYKKFINFRLTGLSPDSPYFNKTYSELDPSIQRKFRNRTLSVTTIKVNDDKDLPKIFEIFRRLNTGGTPLTKQEIRNCICAGIFNDFLINLNKNDKWQTFITNEKDRTRQKDVELILRFFALYDSQNKYKKPMDDFLTLYFQEHRNANEIELKQKEILFCRVVESIYNNLKKKPFHIKNGLNSSVCDAIMIAFSRHLDNIPDDIADRYKQLCYENDEFYSYCGKNSNDPNCVHSRIAMAEDILFKPRVRSGSKIIKLFQLPVSAGTGNWVDGDIVPYTDFVTDESEADFAVKVSGDSMEPRIPNGSILTVKNQRYITSGKIGIFTLNGEIFCKQYFKNSKMPRLISLNKKYKYVTINEEDNFYINGIVLEIFPPNTNSK